MHSSSNMPVSYGHKNTRLSLSPTSLLFPKLLAFSLPLIYARDLAQVTSNPFLPDYINTLCKNDKPADPWMTSVTDTPGACCKRHFSWDVDACDVNSRKWALENPQEIITDIVEEEDDVVAKYWADTTEGICKLDGPDRPSWTTVHEVTFEKCCQDYLSWSLNKCLASKPTVKFTANPTQPPMSSAPVPGLYFTPAPEPSSPISSPPSIHHPNVLLASNSICSDQSLSRFQCESNPKCIWWLKGGIACTYKAWVQPTLKPTPGPTLAPIIIYEFYNIPSSGICAFNDEAKPGWITNIYTDWDECCHEESWDIPKCLAARPEELNEMEIQSSSTATSGRADDYAIIDITMYGSLILNDLILPNMASQDWNDLKRVLTKSLILTLAYDSNLVHPNVRVELLSLGTHPFTWIRLLSKSEVENKQSDSVSSLRGAQDQRRVRRVKKTTSPTQQPALNSEMDINSELLLSSYTLKFAVVIPTKCDSKCQTTGTSLGTDQSYLIEKHLQDFVKSNYFEVQLKREGNAVGLFLDSLPNASDVSLQYRFATKSGEGLTWSPSLSPSLKPTPPLSSSPTVSKRPITITEPTTRIYYPDYQNHICKVADGSESEFEVNYFPSLEKCCKFDWIDYKTCMEFSFRDPSRIPSTMPTVKTSLTPTSPPFKLNSYPIGSNGVVYYPDFDMGVCKSDGTQGEFPYTFSTPEACCDNNYMEYDTCMKYALPKKYSPNPWIGSCQTTDGSENSLYEYSSPEECCKTGMVGAYDTCLANTIKQATSDSTKMPSKKPSSKPTHRPSLDISVPGHYYPDFAAGYCKSVGLHESKPFVFASAEKCCDNNIMDYNDCLLLSIENFQPTITTTTTTTTTTTLIAKVYYPDFVLKVCKFDGNKGNIPYIFSTAHECCDNSYMNYERCMSYAAGYEYAPIPLGGYCQVSIGSESIPYKYVSLEDCCESDMMGDFESCVMLTLERLGHDPNEVEPTEIATQRPSHKPTTTYTIPPVVESAIDGRKFIDEVMDGFENGIGGVFPWSTTSNTPWVIDNKIYNEGISSAKSAPLTKGQTSDLYVAVNSNWGGTFFFSMKSDVQMPYSGFYVNVDNKSKMGYTFPTSDWRDLSLTVEAGQHVLMFRTWIPSISSGSSPTSTGTVNIDKVSFQPHLIENFESKELVWNATQFTGSDWLFDTSNPHSGSVSLRSPDLITGQSSSMSLEFNTASRGSTVEFWFYSDILISDMFEFNLDGFTILQITSSSQSWKKQTKSLVPGKHTLEWKFIKSSDADSKVWIDDIRILPIGM